MTLPDRLLPAGHPAEAAHAALLVSLADHLKTGAIIPCVAAGLDSNPWTTDPKGPAGAAAVRGALAACLDCPALARCREYAINAPETGGIWGGLTARERAEQRPRRHPGRPGRRRAA